MTIHNTEAQASWGFSSFSSCVLPCDHFPQKKAQAWGAPSSEQEAPPALVELRAPVQERGSGDIGHVRQD